MNDCSVVVDEDQNKRETSVEKRQQFGNRALTSEGDVFKHNAWDNVEWNLEQEEEAKLKVKINGSQLLSEEQQEKYESEAGEFWNTFYGIHQNGFFKDRHWLFTEFPELAPYNKDAPERVYPESTSPGDPVNHVSITRDDSLENNIVERRIFEIGCGVGNTIFPILKYSTEPNLKVFGCDFSSTAINIMQEHSEFDPKRCEVFVMNATNEKWEVPFEENSIDIIVLIFVLSALHPDKMPHVARQIYRYLKPGGVLLFRDYGRYDMAQLRFKNGHCLGENFYVRGDGTRVYFFTQSEVEKLFTEAGLVQEQSLIDRRLQVNRGRQLKMYRIWQQAKYRKPLIINPSATALFSGVKEI